MKIAQLPLYLMALLLAAEGCFQYVPEGDVAPTRGSPIRVQVWTGDLGNRTVQKDGLQVELRLERNSCPGTRCYPWTKKPDFSPMSAPA